MTALIVLAVLLLASFIFECFLARTRSVLPGLILPVVYFLAACAFTVLNVTDAFSTVAGYGSFLMEYGSSGMTALILKIGVIFAPSVILLLIWLICRRAYQEKNTLSDGGKEMKKMLADDLD